MALGSSPVAVTYTFDLAVALSKDFLDIHAIMKSGLTLNRVRGMIKTYSQISINW